MAMRMEASVEVADAVVSAIMEALGVQNRGDRRTAGEMVVRLCVHLHKQIQHPMDGHARRGASYMRRFSASSENTGSFRPSSRMRHESDG